MWPKSPDDSPLGRLADYSWGRGFNSMILPAIMLIPNIWGAFGKSEAI